MKGNWTEGRMRAARVTGIGQTDLASVPVPAPEPGTALVRTRQAGICGTDLEILHGTSAFLQDGRITFPHVFGHEWYGEVVAHADGVPEGAPPSARSSSAGRWCRAAPAPAVTPGVRRCARRCARRACTGSRAAQPTTYGCRCTRSPRCRRACPSLRAR